MNRFMDLEEKLRDYFERYPQSKEVFSVKGVLFHNSGAARSYCKSENDIKQFERAAFGKVPAAGESETGSQKQGVEQETVSPETVLTLKSETGENTAFKTGKTDSGKRKTGKKAEVQDTVNILNLLSQEQIPEDAVNPETGEQNPEPEGKSDNPETTPEPEGEGNAENQ